MFTAKTDMQVTDPVGYRPSYHNWTAGTSSKGDYSPVSTVKKRKEFNIYNSFQALNKHDSLPQINSSVDSIGRGLTMTNSPERMESRAPMFIADKKEQNTMAENL